MGFSATGNLLRGSKQRPDIITSGFYMNRTKVNENNFWADESKSFELGSKNSPLNTLGCIPVVSTVTGFGRTSLGLVHTIAHLACSVFSKNKHHHFQEMTLGARNVGRGVIEMIPVIGNIVMLIADLKRMGKFEKMTKEKIDKNKTDYRNQAVMFVNGEEIAKRPLEEVYSAIEKLQRKPTHEDIERIIQNQ